MLTIIMGKAASGKDLLKRELVENEGYSPIVTYTTRPMREGEKEGREYHFMSEEEFWTKSDHGEFIEVNTYSVIENGERKCWSYGSPKLQEDELDAGQNVIVLTPEGVQRWVNYYGREMIFVVYLTCHDSIRYERAVNRGSFEPEEWKRRLISDEEDFESAALFADYILDTTSLYPDEVVSLVLLHKNHFEEERSKNSQ